VPEADPVVGLLISIAILFIVKDAGLSMWRRLMDSVEPDVVRDIEHTAETAAAELPGAEGVSDIRIRWLGHRLHAELSLTVDEDLSTRESHAYAEAVRHALFHARPQLASVIVHVEPCGHGGSNPHEGTAHHR
jgi:divalent metal cation (Fe/Co/Zn/Cd) transporter